MTRARLTSAPSDRFELDDAWRPSVWRVPPKGRSPRGISFEVAVVVVVAAYNVVGNLVLPAWAYVPANLATGAGLLALAVAGGVTREQLGLLRDRVPRGLVVGGAAMALVGVVVVMAVVAPGTRGLFEDARVASASTGERVYHPLLRIPIGTAVFEELVFRGVLLGMFLRRVSPLRAATWSSLLFGLWHVLPTGLTVDNNRAFGDLAANGAGVTVAVVAGVMGTWLAGYLFCWLRLRANSLVAPILLHTATNSFAYLGATVVAGPA